MNPQMTMTTTAASGRTRAPRHRRVRSSYPAALVELALLLCGTVGIREAASFVGVGTSTVYRWMGLHRTAWMPRNVVQTDGRHINDVVGALSNRCQRAGFSMRSSHSDREVNIPIDVSSIFPTIAENSRSGFIFQTSTNDAHATEPMLRAKREIEDNFASRLSCQALADRVAMPRFKFIKKFAATFGVPPYHYLLGVRVKRAWEMLQQSDAPLPAVASATGFGSAASMQRAFKRFAGASPSKIVNVIAPIRNVVFDDSHGTQKFSERQTASV
jgi:AraC-like DNA-binding protein